MDTEKIQKFVHLTDLRHNQSDEVTFFPGRTASTVTNVTCQPPSTTSSPPRSTLIATSSMTDYLRRIVSGGKSRFKDDALNVDLGQLSISSGVLPANLALQTSYTLQTTSSLWATQPPDWRDSIETVARTPRGF
jgi:hypothetical protein